MSLNSRYLIGQFYYGPTKMQYNLYQNFVDEESVGYAIVRKKKGVGVGEVMELFGIDEYGDAWTRFKETVNVMLEVEPVV